ncbi:MAG: hypothetical protein RML93_07720 [Anaerolineales bacterium]|nr:hypothetical protein [Anaerolineales bacterium]MDW8447161.1 hypothetical protein [Anaerolineales bacterium]
MVWEKEKDEFCVSLGPFSIGLATNERKFTERLAAYYRQFLTDEAPILSLRVSLLEGDAEVPLMPKVSPHRIEFDQSGYQGVVDWRARTAYLSLGVKNPLFGVDYFLRLVGALAAESIGGLMVHAAGVEREGKAYLFLGHSGAGKTTTARNSPPGSVLNDDLIVLYRSGERWFAAATPFHNPTQNRPRQGCAPLAVLLYLVKDVRVYLEPTSSAHALAEMLACIPILTLEPFYAKSFLERCQDILRSVPYYRLHLLPDASYWEVVLER